MGSFRGEDQEAMGGDDFEKWDISPQSGTFEEILRGLGGGEAGERCDGTMRKRRGSCAAEIKFSSLL